MICNAQRGLQKCFGKFSGKITNLSKFGQRNPISGHQKLFVFCPKFPKSTNKTT
jgi:hypothetical protein